MSVRPSEIADRMSVTFGI